MRISINYIKDKDLFELQIVEPRLKTHFLINRKIMNDLRALIERALVETAAKRRKSE